VRHSISADSKRVVRIAIGFWLLEGDAGIRFFYQWDIVAVNEPERAARSLISQIAQNAGKSRVTMVRDGKKYL
jgi:hypothetical protein